MTLHGINQSLFKGEVDHVINQNISHIFAFEIC